MNLLPPRVAQHEKKMGTRLGSPAIQLLLLIIGSALFLINEILIKAVTDNPFIHGHLNDILIIWAFIPFLNLLLSLLPIFRTFRIVTLRSCLLLTLLIGIVWEYLLPLLATVGTSDPIDLVMYILGGATYWLLLKIIAAIPSKSR
ncbi:hypothetical protein CIG75_06485 [Tumebacillus algifaecis]|uniref:VanZ-like domain-containing protein n=1 Tax=Tumebacillus algifaecis TaxID=1214604 RepID=A0A223CZ86_9BACL|nr:hypothetical protein [Tumebacillus algifaecis]ASS74651.1 hypothetical protein CIG75_06485 [Tumebacillus algifaecis]